jgi:hypothetical protein
MPRRSSLLNPPPAPLAPDAPDAGNNPPADDVNPNPPAPDGDAPDGDATPELTAEEVAAAAEAKAAKDAEDAARAKAAAELSATLLTADTGMEDVPDDEGPIQVKDAARSDAQKVIDGNVKTAHDAWVAAGKPEEFNKSPRKRRVVAPDQADALRDMLKAAGRLHNLRVRIAPTKTLTDGNAAVYFVVTDRLPPRARRNADTTQDGTPPAADAQGTADPGTDGQADDGQGTEG